MKQTSKLGLNLMETSDVLSAKPLNENTETIDTLLGTVVEKTASVVRMACGSYTGSGKRSVTIQTPGFTPQVVIMRSKQPVGYERDTTQNLLKNQISRMQGPTVDGGWALWMGSDMTGRYYEEETSLSYNQVTGEYDTVITDYTEKTADITFTAANGSLKWSTTDSEAPTRIVNNASGVTYEWVAFGVVE